MAKINGIYVFVKDENKSFGVQATEHPVESGIDITDHVKRNPITMSISGEIVGENASSVMSKLKQIHQSGTFVKYVGRTTLNNCIITDFSTSHPHNIWGGCSFAMTLKEIRVASTSYKKKKDTGNQQPVKKSEEEWVYHTVKSGDCVWNLVAAKNAPYKQYGMTCDEIMALNPDAFSRPGDFRTLQVGAKLKMGKR